MKLLFVRIFVFLLPISLVSSIFAQNNNALLQTALDKKQSQYDLTFEDVHNWEITDSHTDRKTGITFYYLTQKYDGLLVHNAITVLAKKNQDVALTANGFIAELAKKTETTTAIITAKEAILLGAQFLGLENAKEITLLERKDKNHYIFDAQGLSKEEINVRLKLFQTDEAVVRAVWDMDIYQLDQKHWWSIRIDAQTGKLRDKKDWVINCSFEPNSCSYVEVDHETTEVSDLSPRSGAGYNVFAIPVESPNFGTRSLVVNPADPLASPYGWHDVNGITGSEFTTTKGNNVYASEDWDDLDILGYLPDGGPTLNFDFPLDLNQDPINSIDAAITNLFYMNNIMHDVWYHYGFDEVSGNFQNNNYGKGGLAYDYVLAQAQDGGGMNNSNMAVGPDGYRPTMQMYLWRSYAPYLLTVNSPYSISGPYFTRQAYFGPRITDAPITSEIVIYDDNLTDPMDACESAVNASALNNKIALIRRGSCDFTVQVQNAENAGAIAAIVVNDLGGFPFPMYGSEPGIGIPSVMISKADGLGIITKLQNNETVTATLQGAPGEYDIDGDFDNGIVAHEYGHGISVRLTGGASMAGCLNNEEEMGEGWSDWFALMLTIKAGDLGSDGRGIATYAYGEGPDGDGLRPLKYSTDFNINNITYGATNDTVNISFPHGIGFVWASMLWDLTWKLIDKYGYDPDLYHGTGGNNIAMHLVINGLKLQGCEPGFVDGRDAILAADELLYNGQNKCLIWDVFAKRGLGYSADQGSTDSRIDQTEAFDLPPEYNSSETVTSCGSYTWAVNHQTYSTTGVYTETLNNINGCDSIVTLNLTIHNVDTQINIATDEITLISSPGNDAYQWVDCNQGYAIVNGANTFSFTVPNNGDYAVIINDGICSDTSVCLTIDKLFMAEEEINSIKIYPNPTNGMVTIDFLDSYEATVVRVYDMVGKLVQELNIENQEQFQFYLKGESGVYTIEVQNQQGTIQRIRIAKFN